MNVFTWFSVGAVLQTNSGETEIVARLLADKDKVAPEVRHNFRI